MSNFRRRLMGVQQHGGLPAGYQQVEYIESTGTQWINTNYIVQSNDQFEITYQVTDINVPNIFSATGLGGNDMRFHTWKSSVSGCLVVGLGKGFNNRVTLNTNKSVITIDASANTNPTLNGTSLPYNSTSPYTTFEANELNTPLYLFRANINLGKTRIYSVNIKDKMNLISCLDNTGTPCMYDTVSKQTFYNQGTGEFSYPIDEKYNRVEFLKSTGTQYIDTGIKLNQNSRVKIKYQYSAGTSTARVFGDAHNGSKGWVLTTQNGSINSKIQTLYGDAWKPQSNEPQGIIPSTNIVEFERNGVNQYVNNNLYYTNQSSNFETTSTAIVFGAYYNSLSLSSIKLYELWIWEDGTNISRHFIPCYRKSDNKPGLYDTVTKEFYTNQGSGEFLYE